MAKKRRSFASPMTRSKEVKDKDLSHVSHVKSPPSSPDDMLEVANSVSPTELVTARGKLKNVLQVLFDQTDDSPDSSQRLDVGLEASPSKVNVKKEKTLTPASFAPRMGRKRRSRAPLVVHPFHHTYVMKLFDRSVDLAQFKESTPLYPICRAWMANQPRNTSLGAPPQPSAPAEEEDGGEGTRSMPPPKPMPVDPVERMRMKIPEPVHRERVGEIDMDMEVKPAREVLLREHLSHWTAVRKKWHSTGHKNEERFAASAQIVRNIFKRAQREFE